MLLFKVMKLIINIFIAIALVSIFLFKGYSDNSKPDLKQLYTQSRSVTDQPPVVFIHGLLGSKLRDKQSQVEVWPGSTFNVLFGNHDHFAPKIDPETLEVKPDEYEPFALAKQTVGQDFYGNIIKTMSDYGGYEEATLGQEINTDRKYYYTFVYDWRQDNIESVRKLADFIEQIRKDYDNPDLKVDIVAHSMGGLIARYYLRYGRTDVLNSNDFPVNLYGAERLRRIILLGTPNLGSAKQVKAFIEGVDIAFGKISPEAMITMPSLYQLLPHALNNWLVNEKGEELKEDLFDIKTWRKYKWNIFSEEIRTRIQDRFDSDDEAAAHLKILEAFLQKSLERARRFTWALTVKLPEEHPTLIVFGGDCSNTPARVLIEEVDGKQMVRMRPEEIATPLPNVNYETLLLEPGDGIVTKASLLGRDVLDPSVPRHKYSFFPVDYAILLCEEHRTLTNNVNFQNNLLNALLVRD
jgi:pimeloyl-ACP methyl ester carboxylesterase